jgi:hypothetical protein
MTYLQFINEKYLDPLSWGGAYGGSYHPNGRLFNQDVGAYYWTQSENSYRNGFQMLLFSNGTILPQSYVDKGFGFTLRCVR